MLVKEKKPYCKPEMEQVKLVPEEAVLGGCKTESGAGVLPVEIGGCVVGGCSTSNILS